MLKNFIFLNEIALDSYLSSIEDGIRSTAQSTVSGNSVTNGSVNIRIAAVGGEKGQHSEEVQTRADTPGAKFERLIRFGQANPELAGWINVQDPDSDLADIGIGAMIELECEIYVPDSIQMLTQSADAFKQLQGLMPHTASLGFDTTGLPTSAEIEAISSLSSSFGKETAFIGELEGSEWQIGGKIPTDRVKGELDGPVRLVGKVAHVVKSGSWKNLLALPGSNLVSRAERRNMERRGPQTDNEDHWLRGPAILLDTLAIYR